MLVTFISEYNQAYHIPTSCYYCLRLTLCYKYFPFNGVACSNRRSFLLITVPSLEHCCDSPSPRFIQASKLFKLQIPNI